MVRQQVSQAHCNGGGRAWDLLFPCKVGGRQAGIHASQTHCWNEWEHVWCLFGGVCCEGEESGYVSEMLWCGCVGGYKQEEVKMHWEGLVPDPRFSRRSHLPKEKGCKAEIQ